MKATYLVWIKSK